MAVDAGGTRGPVAMGVGAPSIAGEGILLGGPIGGSDWSDSPPSASIPVLIGGVLGTATGLPISAGASCGGPSGPIVGGPSATGHSGGGAVRTGGTSLGSCRGVANAASSRGNSRLAARRSARTSSEASVPPSSISRPPWPWPSVFWSTTPSLAKACCARASSPASLYASARW